MNYKDIPPITPLLWISNLIEAASDIADKERQEARWLAPDAYAWENPNELFCTLFDDCNFELFLEEYGSTFSSDQSLAAFNLRNAMNSFDGAMPQRLDSAEVLADPRWEDIRQKARAFVEVFKDKWPVDAIVDGSGKPTP